MDKEYKNERDNLILFRGLRRENELTKMAKKSCSNQKIYCIIENMYIKPGLSLEYPFYFKHGFLSLFLHKSHGTKEIPDCENLVSRD